MVRSRMDGDVESDGEWLAGKNFIADNAARASRAEAIMANRRKPYVLARVPRATPPMPGAATTTKLMMEDARPRRSDGATSIT